MGFVLHQGATVLCMHGGQAMPTDAESPGAGWRPAGGDAGRTVHRRRLPVRAARREARASPPSGSPPRCGSRPAGSRCCSRTAVAVCAPTGTGLQRRRDPDAGDSAVSQVDFPYGVDARGRTASTSDDEHVRDLIEQVLFTAPGERVNRPDLRQRPAAARVRAEQRRARRRDAGRGPGRAPGVARRPDRGARTSTVEAVDSTLTVDRRLRGSPDAAVADGDLHEGGLMAVAAAQYRCGDARRRRSSATPARPRSTGSTSSRSGPIRRPSRSPSSTTCPASRTAYPPRRRSDVGERRHRRRRADHRHPRDAGRRAPTNVLTVTVDASGDFSTYVLRLRTSITDDSPPATFDPQLSSVPFSFKVDCPTDFDCAVPDACPPEVLPEPEIDYLAKDYASFRQLMLDRLAALAPDWTERNPADLGIALVELLAYVGDHLSYYQDAVATEAYLGTAATRVSAAPPRAPARLPHARRLQRPGVGRLRRRLRRAAPTGRRSTPEPCSSHAATPPRRPSRRQTCRSGWSRSSRRCSRRCIDHAPRRAQRDQLLHLERRPVLPAEGRDPRDAEGRPDARPRGRRRRPLRGAPQPDHRARGRRRPDASPRRPAHARGRTTVDELARPRPVLEIGWAAPTRCRFRSASPRLVGSTEDEIAVARGNVVLADHGLSIAAEPLVPQEVPAGRAATGRVLAGRASHVPAPAFDPSRWPRRAGDGHRPARRAARSSPSRARGRRRWSPAVRPARQRPLRDRLRRRDRGRRDRPPPLRRRRARAPAAGGLRSSRRLPRRQRPRGQRRRRDDRASRRGLPPASTDPEPAGRHGRSRPRAAGAHPAGRAAGLPDPGARRHRGRLRGGDRAGSPDVQRAAAHVPLDRQLVHGLRHRRPPRRRDRVDADVRAAISAGSSTATAWPATTSRSSGRVYGAARHRARRSASRRATSAPTSSRRCSTRSRTACCPTARAASSIPTTSPSASRSTSARSSRRRCRSQGSTRVQVDTFQRFGQEPAQRARAGGPDARPAGDRSRSTTTRTSPRTAGSSSSMKGGM